MIKRSLNERLNDNGGMPKISELTDPKAIARFGGAKLLIAPTLGV